MKFHLKFTDEQGHAEEIEADSRDIANWERTTKGASMGQLGAEMRITDLYKIGWFALKRLSLPAGQLQLAELEKTHMLELGEEVVDEEAEVPTRATR